MLKSISLKCIQCIALTCIFTLSFSAHGAPKKETIDLSIIDQRAELIPHMSSPQRVTLVKLEAEIEDAESDIRSGQYLMQSKPSSFKSEDEVKKDIERGKDLLESASLQLTTAQIELVTFLQTVEKARIKQQALSAKKFDFSITSESYNDAFKASVANLLKSAQEQGYKTVLFDKVFVTDSSTTEAITADAHNNAYDQIVEIDGTNLAVSVPIDLKISKEGQLTFENLETFADDSIALLAIELVKHSTDQGLLHTRLIDIRDHHVLSHTLTHVTDFAQLSQAAESNSATDEVDAAAPNEAATDTIETEAAVTMKVAPSPRGAIIRDEGMWIDRLAQQSYAFEVLAQGDSALFASALLTHTLLENSTLKIVDEAFIKRAYASEDASLETKADAQFTLSEEADNYLINARSFSSSNVIEIGSMQLTYE